MNGRQGPGGDAGSARDDPLPVALPAGLARNVNVHPHHPRLAKDIAEIMTPDASAEGHANARLIAASPDLFILQRHNLT